MSNTTANVESVENKNVAFRIFAFLFAALGIASLFIPYAYVMRGNVATRTSFFSSAMDLINGKGYDTLFGFLPTHAVTRQDMLTYVPNVRGIVTGVIYYVFLLLVLVSAIVSLVAVFNAKKAPRLFTVSVFIFLFAYSMYALWNFVYVMTINKKVLLDYVCLGGTAIFMLVSFVLAIQRRGAKAWFSVLQFVLSLTVSSILILAMEANTEAFKGAFAKFGLKAVKYQDLAIYVLVTLCALNILAAYVRIQVKRGIPFEVIRYILQIVILGGATYIEFAFNNKPSKLYGVLCVVACLISIFQIILACLQIKKITKEKKAKKQQESLDEATVEEYIVQEQVEPVSYDGGPIAGVETAELVDENEEDSAEAGATAPAQKDNAEEDSCYDFYNTKSFDPFIATLNKAEREEFTDLFILRCKGDMPEIPEYVVGEPKKAFFNKIFVSLGKYRDAFSDELLSKIYDFSLKLKK